MWFKDAFLLLSSNQISNRCITTSTTTMYVFTYADMMSVLVYNQLRTKMHFNLTQKCNKDNRDNIKKGCQSRFLRQTYITV